MPKINHEEYEVLKELDDKWKWIARDEAQQTYAYEYRPIKSKLRGRWESNWNDYYLLPHDWLQFIQWEDEEPYNIAELIEEYEKDYKGSWEHAIEFSGEVFGESEETEVKKDKEWLLDEIERITDEYSNQSFFTNYARYMISEIEEAVNQLDEPEVLLQEITYEEALKVIAENIDTDEFSIGLYLEALSNNEKYEFLTEKWIEDNTSPVDDEGRLYVWKRDLQNLLVPKESLGNSQKLEKVQIPQFVADFIEVRKGTDAYSLKYILCVAVERSEQEEYTKAYDWISANDELFARAWLDGYEVEEEQKYYARIKGWENVTTGSEAFNWVYFKEKDTIGISKAVENKYQAVSFTKNDWNNLGINEHNADFVLVEELEE